MPIPVGVIAIWRGTIANIPAGWDLCDGNGGRPNLLSKFLRSVPAATNPGGTGGSDTHTHTDSAGNVAAHNHGGTAASGGSHTHSAASVTTGSHAYSVHGVESMLTVVPGPLYCGNASSGGNHDHTWPSGGSHTHSIDTQGGHSHTLQNADTRPAYYQVAFIYSDGTPANFAQGVITLWSDVLGNIPAGWSLDTTLVAKFLRSVPAATDPGGTGGSDSHPHTQNAAGAHTHALSARTHYHTSNSGGSHKHGTYYYEIGLVHVGRSLNKGSHTHRSSTSASHTHTALSNGSHSHTINVTDGRPPYSELAPIDADAGGASLEVGLICIWTGTIANIPADWELCDGNGGRPNLLSKFIRGVATAGTNPGGTGGNLTHTHTVLAAGNHTHSRSSSGSASHTCRTSTWSHDHGDFLPSTGPSSVLGLTLYGPSHSHGNLNTTGSHSNHTITASGTHVLHTYNTASSLPAYYEVAFIYCTSAVVIVAPTVTTQAADNIGIGAGTLHGTITATGGENCSERGFDYDYDSGVPYASSWTETDSYGIGIFEKALAGLTQGATLYFRAKAQNSAGWGYGGELSFKIPKAWTKTLTELLGLVDTYSRTWTIQRTYTEALGLVDSYSRSWSLYRTYSELLGLADVVSKESGKTFPEALGLVDTVRKSPSIMRVEALGLVDVYSRTWSLYRTYTELLGLLDSVSKGVALHPLETLGLIDSISKVPALTRSEMLGLSDSVAKGASLTRVELLGLLDSVSKGVALPLTEPLGLVDSYSRVWSAQRTYTEILGLKDTISKQPSITLEELLGLKDFLSYIKNPPFEIGKPLVGKLIQLVNINPISFEDTPEIVRILKSIKKAISP